MARATLSYRPDIDGLRAVAVAAVLVFHAFPSRLRAGFIGVDIFFVISGFLITGILLDDLDGGRFSLARFYSRRIRRIFPALSLILAVTFLLGWALLGESEFRQLSKHLAGGAGFVSNLLLWREAGYFDHWSQSKPLLHLWSLGIEEQFYIAWPLLLAALFRRVGKLLPAIGVLALLSFCLNLLTVSRHPEAAFYNPATRVWELLIGAAAAVYMRSRATAASPLTREAIAVLGIVLIGASLIWIDDVTPFPGRWALAPTVGTALLIVAGADAWVNRRLLATRGLVLVGKISYPLYLWHWPLLTYFNLVNESDLHLSDRRATAVRLVLLGLSCMLAWATWHFWESPIRGAKTLGRVPTVKGLGAGMIALCAVGALGAFGWMPSRLNNPEASKIVSAITDWDPLPYQNYRQSTFRLNEYPSSSPRTTLIAGDSHAEQYLSRVKWVLKSKPEAVSVSFATHPNCPPLPGLNPAWPGFDCPGFYRFWTAQAAHANTVVIAAYWEMYFAPSPTGRHVDLVNSSGERAQEADIEKAWQELENAVRRWVAAGKQVALISSNPSSKTFDPLRALRRLGRTDVRLLEPVSEDALNRILDHVEQRLARLATRTGAKLIRPAEYLCANGLCPAVDGNGQPIYLDEDHIRAHAAEKKATFLDELLR